MDESHYLTLVIAAIAVLGIGAQWLAWRLQLPAIVLLCLFGILVGPASGLVVPSRDLEGLVFQFFVSIGSGSPGAEVAAGLLLGTVTAVVLGYTSARLVARALIGGWIPEYLKPAVLIMLVFLVYEVANAAQAEAGLLAATVMGVVLSNLGLADIHEIRRFKEYLAVLLVSTIFILLTADLDAAALAQLDWRLLALPGAVIFLVRPAAVLLSTIGYLLAATDNDAYNALVCSHYVRSLGREYVFKLPKDTEDNPRQIQRTITGRTLYGPEARCENLVEHHYRGWCFQKTRITTGYTARQCSRQMGQETMPLLAVKADGSLSLPVSGKGLNLAPGDTVITYMSPTAQAERKKDPARVSGAAQRPGPGDTESGTA